MSNGTFIYEPKPQRVIFGSSTLALLADEAARLGVSRVLVLSTPGQRALAERAAAILGARVAHIFAGAVMHTPVEVSEQAVDLAKSERADAIVAIGGGSTTGLGKAIARRTGLPQIVVPTTYAGSEMTSILGETAGGEKKTIRDPKLLPGTVIYDVDLTLGLPAAVSATSGLNAIAHAVEGLYAKDGNPVLTLMAEDGIRALNSALPVIARAPADPDARRDALHSAFLCGAVLGGTSMALHHKLCHVLGGSFGLPHAETHAVILPHAAAYNSAAAPDAMRRIARALGAGSAPAGLHALAVKIGAPLTLAQIGMPAGGLDRAADIAAANPYDNPRPIDRAGIRHLLDDAFHGRQPAATRT